MGREIADPVELTCPLQRELFRYWDDARDGRPFPDRASIDPTELPRGLLSSLALYDVVGSPPDFFCSLAGTRVVEEHGRELTGARLSELPLSRLEAVLAEYRRAVATGKPRYSEFDYAPPGKIERRVARLLLPLSKNSARVDMILGAYAWHKSMPSSHDPSDR